MRLTKDEWLLQMAELTTRRSTCVRRAVGCVLANEKGHVLATGYNGVPRGMPHCNEKVVDVFPPGVNVVGASPLGNVVESYPNACAGATAPSGTNLDLCDAVHAEQNALLQCGDVEEIHTAYVTVSPCLTCVKLLMNTACQRIIFRAPYAHDDASRQRWQKAGRLWICAPAAG